jgi:hypothetical protein
VGDAEMVVSEYKKVTKAEDNQVCDLLESRLLWVKPASGWMKVNVDTALDRRAGKMGFGLIMRDHEGKFIAAKSIMRMGLWDSAASEALEAYFGVILGQEIGVQKMILEGDAKQIIDAIQEKDKQDSMIGHLIDDVRLSLENIPEWKVDHVYRETNRVAHGLAKLALK